MHCSGGALLVNPYFPYSPFYALEDAIMGALLYGPGRTEYKWPTK